MNLCERVRVTCCDWYQNNQDLVSISQEAIDRLAQTIDSSHDSKPIEWDEEGWHYRPPTHWPKKVRCERLAQYILALDAINFCFWPYDFEYEDLARSLAKAAERDHKDQEAMATVSPEFAFSASKLRDADPKYLLQLFPKIADSIDDELLAKRCLLWNEVGSVLLEQFEGSIWNLLQSAGFSAVKTVSLIVHHFPGFRDIYACEPHLFLLKRTQICVADLFAALGSECEITSDDGISNLTTFADYRVPQLLWQTGVLIYHPKLTKAIEQQEEIVPGSRAELSIRAATVEAVEQLVFKLSTLSPSVEWSAVKVDWFLWQVGEKRDTEGSLQPHHRVRTTCY